MKEEVGKISGSIVPPEDPSRRVRKKNIVGCFGVVLLRIPDNSHNLSLFLSNPQFPNSSYPPQTLQALSWRKYKNSRVTKGRKIGQRRILEKTHPFKKPLCLNHSKDANPNCWTSEVCLALRQFQSLICCSAAQHTASSLQPWHSIMKRWNLKTNISDVV